MRLAVFNQKGGVGKTTTALNLAAGLARRHLAPLAVDLDSQAHLTGILAPIDESAASAFALFGDAPRPVVELARTVVLAGDGEGRLVPGHIDLMRIDSLYGKGPRVLLTLRAALDALPAAERDQPVLIDCCPMLGVLSLVGVFAADRVLVPVSTDYLAVRGALALEHTLKALEPVLKKRLPRRYVLTRFDARRGMARRIETELRERFGEDLCETHVAESVALAESPFHSRDIFAYAAASRGAQDYTRLLEELLASGFLEV
jgi:chromosome partitioning protein